MRQRGFAALSSRLFWLVSPQDMFRSLMVPGCKLTIHSVALVTERSNRDGGDR